MASSNGTSNGMQQKMTLYTNHACPWAHRAHVALEELGIPFEEVIIDLDVPREEWYLKINPRGLVPALQLPTGEIIIESGIVAQYLADASPSHLLPASNSPGAALFRAKVNIFVSTFFDKALPVMMAALGVTDPKEAEAKAQDFVAVLEKEIEPLLQDAAPFFGGSEKLTLAEVQAASFILRLYSWPKYGVISSSLPTALDRLPNFSRWAKAIHASKSATKIYDEEKSSEKIKAKVEKMRAAAAAAANGAGAEAK
ncbi:MAG: hypothetical protein M1837_002138 [Sclerophora amabilis]|nr:MAG: hypothetical protein M1837_002138 [Sclerophora amabilis]